MNILNRIDQPDKQAQIDQPNQTLNPSFSWIRIGLLVAAFVILFAGTISELMKTWISRDDYSHGFLIPIISLYILWVEKEKLKYLPVRPNILYGMILILIGGLLLLMGSIGSVVMIQGFSLVVIIYGLVITLLGIGYFKAFSLPLIYLILMVPILDLVIEKIHWPFQLFSVSLASVLLTICKIPVVKNAQYLELPNVILEVAQECSGVNYLISIFAISIPLAYFTQRRWWSRVMIVILAIIIGILTNALRVSLIGIWSYLDGEVSHGPLHIFQGLFVSIVGFIFLIIITWLFSRFLMPRFSLLNDKENRTEEKVLTSNILFDSTKFNKAWLIATMSLLCLGIFIYLYHPIPVPLKTGLNTLPEKIGEWRGENITYHEASFKVPGADYEVIKTYTNDSDRQVNLHIGYFESQRQGKELIQYALESLHRNSEEIEIPIDSFNSIRVIKAMHKDGAKTNMILLWYDLNGRITTNKYRVKLFTALDGLVYRRTNGAFVIIYSDLKRSDEINSVLNDEVEFVKETIPVIRGLLD